MCGERDTLGQRAAMFGGAKKKKQGEWLRIRLVNKLWHHHHTMVHRHRTERMRTPAAGLKQTCTEHYWVKQNGGPLRSKHHSPASPSASLSSEHFLAVVFISQFAKWDDQNSSHGGLLRLWWTKSHHYGFSKPSPTFKEHLNTSSQKLITTATESNPGPENAS